jgi:lysophospholipase L1-like esterase
MPSLVKTILLMAAVCFIGGVAPPVASRSYLALGDSYTIGESIEPQDRYPVQAAQLLRSFDHLHCKDPDIIATTGWTTTDLLNAISNADALPVYDAVTLLIGVNNQYQGRDQSEYRSQFTTLIQRSIALAGNRPSHVLVLSIPDYSVTPFARGVNTAFIASRIDSFNTINRQVSAQYKVNYVDVTVESRKAAYDPSLVAADGLHFSGKEYGIWARLMEPVMKGMLK